MRGHHRGLLIALFVLVGVVAVVGVPAYLTLISFDDLCGNNVVAIEVSPDHARKAVLFERDCGATTGFSSQVSVLRADATLANAGGNVFAANEGRGGEVTSWGGPFVGLHWRDAQTLELTHESRADVRFKVDRLDDVTIVYQIAP